MPETAAPKAEALGAHLATFKALFDLGWKAIVVLWFVFQFYTNQNTLLKDSGKYDSRLRDIETNYNKLDRELVEQKAYALALKEQVDNDRQFYMLTRK